MHIQFTDEAGKLLDGLIEDSGRSVLRLEYDTDDCGCGVNGVPLMRLDDKTDPADMHVESDRYTVVMNREQSLFFRKNMTVEVFKGAFRLKSDEGILNPVISVKQVKEKAEVL
ncbi:MULTISPECIES: iron-sulfur cluster biosynthesis family protein [Salimicrobium]|uniref:Uncharacterized protein YqkB n=2 Tax=Salimicrobium TaxID=351195 RepID=A0ABY1KNV1_9BACI|nr:MULTISPECIES: iron-sulfur cluster biosynthesis family protein [Salimicrobium]SDX70645.1 Uncharacterized protein YqkB [Salimicrobium album]SIS55019.1 Uncharacterized protein YqkB [Salimicrobium salexigens]